jgi:hypothetical protein
MPRASSRAIALVLISARPAASGAAMSSPRFVVPGDDGGHVLGAYPVEVHMYLTGPPERRLLLG